MKLDGRTEGRKDLVKWPSLLDLEVRRVGQVHVGPTNAHTELVILGLLSSLEGEVDLAGEEGEAGERGGEDAIAVNGSVADEAVELSPLLVNFHEYFLILDDSK